VEAKIIQVVYVKSDTEQSFFTLEGQLICTIHAEKSTEKEGTGK